MADIDAPLSWRMQQDGYLMQIDQLRTENAKLRELVASVWRLFAEHGAVNPCDLPEVDAVRNDMRELGVEVDG